MHRILTQNAYKTPSANAVAKINELRTKVDAVADLVNSLPQSDERDAGLAELASAELFFECATTQDVA